MDAIMILRAGAEEAKLMQVLRVPCVGEWLILDGLPRRVSVVRHAPIPWENPWPMGALGAPVVTTITMTGQQPTAFVTVTDD